MASETEATSTLRNPSTKGSPPVCASNQATPANKSGNTKSFFTNSSPRHDTLRESWGLPPQRRDLVTVTFRRQVTRASREPRAVSAREPGSGTAAVPVVLQPFTLVVPARVFAVSAKTQPLMVPARMPLPPAAADMVKLDPA